MIIFVKFDSKEARVAFKRFLSDIMGITLCEVQGFSDGWAIQYNPDSDYEEGLKYLHDLGAFKWYNEV